jgi:mono/diheme cytochrome c family protein
MNGYKVISLVGLLLLVAVLPIYVIREPERMDQAQMDLRREFVTDAAVIYIENCALCHGADGEGIGANPALDNSALWTADYDFLFKTIARGRYGTTMTGWHADEGGILNNYQIDELIALIRYVDWSMVRELAATQGLIPPTLPVPQVEEEFLQEVAAISPEGVVWAAGMRIYAENCTTCHGLHGEGSSIGVPVNTADIQSRDTAALARTISEGVPGTAMVAWKNALNAEDIDALVTFLQNWAAIENAGLVLEQPEPIQIDLDNPKEVMALGERIFNTTCAACHGENGSGGTGPALNSLQFLTRKSDDQMANTIINGSHRPNSSMPAFGDRLTSVEIGAIVDYIRAWEESAIWVDNPRGTQQGGGPPWLRATPDADNPITPGGANGAGAGKGGGPPWRQNETDSAGGSPALPSGSPILLQGQVLAITENMLSLRLTDGSVVEAMLGPPWFWSEKGILLNVGDEIELEGFESPDHMELNWLINHSTGESIQLRSAEGLPVWSGGGNESSSSP